MRKSVNYTAGLSLTTSTVALLDDPSPELFESLTERVMPKLKYTILRFPITQELAVHDKMENSKFQMQDGIRRNGTFVNIIEVPYCKKLRPYSTWNINYSKIFCLKST